MALRKDRDKNDALMEEIRGLYNARVDAKLKKRKASQEAMKMRKAARADEDTDLYTEFSEERVAAMQEFLNGVANHTEV